MNNALGTEDIRKLVARLSIPSIVAMLANALYNIVDRIFIGQFINPIAIGGVYIVLPITFIITAFTALIGVGGNTLMSIYLGEGNKKRAEEITSTSFYMLAIVGIVLSIILIFFRTNILNFFGTTSENYHYALEYLDYIIFGVPFFVLATGMNNFIRGTGDAKGAMNTILIGVILNIILDPIFMVVFKLGVKGAAIATVISQIISCIYVLVYFVGKKSILHLHKFKEVFYSDHLKNSIYQIIQNGMAIFLIQIANSVVTSLINYQLKTYGGALATSSISIISSVSTIMFMPIFGINQGIQPILGYNYGAKNYSRVKEAYKVGATIATIIMVIGFASVMLFPETISLLFVKKSDLQGDLLKILVPALKRTNLGIMFIGVGITGTAFFQAVKRPKIAMITSLLRQVIIMIPILLVLPQFIGLNGVWYSYPISDILSSIITLSFVYKIHKEVKKECIRA